MPLDKHDIDDEGFHDEEECELCLETDHSCLSECRCGACCASLILEASLRDAEREPRIAAECRPLREIGPEPIGYLLNDAANDHACHFLDQKTGLCTIYSTRPLMCRVFDCDRWQDE